MPTDPNRVLWDTCVIIDALQETPGRFDAIAPFIEDAERGVLQIVVSEVSVAETAKLKRLDDEGVSRKEQRDLINKWFQNPYIVRRVPHRGISELSQTILSDHNLKSVNDAIILATAVFYAIPVLHTFDGMKRRGPSLLKLDGCMGDPPIRIVEPDHAQGTLWGPRNGPEGLQDDEARKENTRRK